MGARWSARFAAAALCSVGVALLTWLTWTAPSAADVGAGHERASPAAAPAAGGGPFAGRIAIRGGRKIYLECRGSGRPLVMLEAGTGNLGSIWTEPPDGPGPPVLPAVARFTRVCAYDRPGTYTYPDTFSRATRWRCRGPLWTSCATYTPCCARPAPPGPYVLAGHSFGGMVARLYATNHPRAVAGLVSVDAQNEDYAAAYKASCLPPDAVRGQRRSTHSPRRGSRATRRWSSSTSSRAPPRCARHRPIRRCARCRSSSSHTPGPSRTRSMFPPDFPIEALEQRVSGLTGHAGAGSCRAPSHVIAAKSTHYIQLDQPKS